MRIYLVLQYHKGEQGNVWADVQAFTSAVQQSKALNALPKDADAEGIDMEVSKRAYNKRQSVGLDCQNGSTTCG